MEATVEQLAKRGEHCDVMNALTLLVRAYIKMCGLSLGYRTVVYCAAEPWLERLAWKDLPLSELARKEALVTLMPHITSEYEPDLYDKYDISGMDKEELMNSCTQIVRSQDFFLRKDDTHLPRRIFLPESIGQPIYNKVATFGSFQCQITNTIITLVDVKLW